MAIFFSLHTQVIKDSCTFNYYYNNTPIEPEVLDGDDEIILANWLNNKYLKCTISNDIPHNSHIIHMYWLIGVFFVIVN